MATNLVTVYDTQGAAHEMTYANARDMVVHRGWRWQQVEVVPEATVTEAPSIPASIETVVSVFDPDGNEHQMTWANARDLIRHSGWTRERLVKAVEEPVTQPVTTAEDPAEKKAEEPAPQPVTEEVNVAEPATAEKSAPDFDAMTAKEIEAWAKAELGLDLDGRWSKAKMIAAVREKIAA